ncbi:MAG: hypothetical protein ACXADS_14220 [Candidatus Thorarchaeota archaeon]|jgi:hypothetical protein
MSWLGSVTHFKGYRIILAGIVVAISGIVLDIILTELYWSSKPHHSLGPILIDTAGLFFIFPLGLLILGYGLVSLVRHR